MKKILLTGLISISSLVASNGQIYIDVIDSTPVYRTVTIKTPERECWVEKIRVQERKQDAAGMFLGVLIGGAIGNQFGGGSGKAVATGVGAVAGANMMGNQETGDYRIEEIEKCKIVQKTHQEERLTHYENKGIFNGQEIIKTSLKPLNSITIHYRY